MDTEIFLDSDFPTQVMEDYWVYASVRKQVQHPQKFKQIKSGKWLIFSDIKEHDQNWQKVKRATQQGILGVRAKAASATPALLSNPPDSCNPGSTRPISPFVSPFV